MKKAVGYTLIELVVVCAFIGIVVVIAMEWFASNGTTRGREVERISPAHAAAARACDGYLNANGRCQSSEDTVPRSRIVR